MALGCDAPDCHAVGLKALRSTRTGLYHYFCERHYLVHKDLPMWKRDEWCEYEDRNAVEQAIRYPDADYVRAEVELRANWRRVFIPGLPRVKSLKAKLEAFRLGTRLYYTKDGRAQ